jgi:hypothetical protein
MIGAFFICTSIFMNTYNFKSNSIKKLGLLFTTRNY